MRFILGDGPIWKGGINQLGRSGPVLEPQWIVTGGAGEITVTHMPVPLALIATGGAGTITIEG